MSLIIYTCPNCGAKFCEDDELFDISKSLFCVLCGGDKIETFEKYQRDARRSGNPKESMHNQLIKISMGLISETGEVIEHIKKHLFLGHELNNDYLTKELGDVLWHLAILSDIIKVPLEEIAQKNINKLLNRYLNGFNAEKSINYLKELQSKTEDEGS